MIALFDRNSNNHARHIGRHVCRICGIGFDRLGFGAIERLVDHLNFAWLAVEFEEDGPRAIWLGLAGSQEANNQSLALLDIDRNLFGRIGTVEEVGGRQHAHVAMGLIVFDKLFVDFRVKNVRDALAISGCPL